MGTINIGERVKFAGNMKNAYHFEAGLILQSLKERTNVGFLQVQNKNVRRLANV